MKKLVVGITAHESIVLIKGQLKYFSDRNYKVYLLAPDHQSVGKFCQMENVIHLPVEIKRDISLISDIISLIVISKYLLSIRPDIVNVGTPKMGLLGIIAAWLVGVNKRIYTCRGLRYEHESGFKRKLLKLMEMITCRLSTYVVCISNSLKNYILEENLTKCEKCEVIHKGSSNGIDFSKFNNEEISIEKIIQLKTDLDLHNMFVYGFVGRIIDRKGINELIEAFIQIFEKHPNVRLLIVGDYEFEQLSNPNIKSIIENQKGIVYVGFQSQVSLYMKLMDCFVLPAWWEGFGNVLIQAACMGLPVISTRATGTQDAVKDGYNGLLIKPRDKSALIDAMLEYSQNSVIRSEHAKNGVEWAKNFSSEEIWSGLDRIYNQ